MQHNQGPQYYNPGNGEILKRAYENFHTLVHSKLCLGDAIEQKLRSSSQFLWKEVLDILASAKEKNSLIMLDNQNTEHHVIAGILLALGMPGVVQFNYMQSVVSLAKLDVLNATNGTKGRELGKRVGTHTVHNFEKETLSTYFDFSNLPVPESQIHAFINYMFSQFPLAFRAPENSSIPEFMRCSDKKTAQIVCPPVGDPFFETTSQGKHYGEDLWKEKVGLFCTSANASSDTVGYEKQAPHTNPRALFNELYNREGINLEYVVPFFSISDTWAASKEKMSRFKNSMDGVIISSTTNLFLDPELQKGSGKVVFTCGRHGSVPQEALKKAIKEGPFSTYFDYIEADLIRLPERENYDGYWQDEEELA